MSFPLPAVVTRIWTKCRTLAPADLPPDAGDVDFGAVPRFRASEKTVPLVGAAQEEIADVHSPADAEQLVLHLTQVMDGLLAVVEEETNLIRAGHADIPTHVAQSKADLAREYSADLARLQRSRLYLRQMLPVSFAVLHHRHEAFRALLQVNLALLAIERGATAAPIDQPPTEAPGNALVAEAPVDDLPAESPRAISPPHRPKPQPAHLPRLSHARCCPLPRRLQQTRRQARGQRTTPVPFLRNRNGVNNCSLARVLDGEPASASPTPALQHDPKKWTPVFGKDHALTTS
jgi:hypothetical protein